MVRKKISSNSLKEYWKKNLKNTIPFNYSRFSVEPRVHKVYLQNIVDLAKFYSKCEINPKWMQKKLGFNPNFVFFFKDKVTFEKINFEEKLLRDPCFLELSFWSNKRMSKYLYRTGNKIYYFNWWKRFFLKHILRRENVL
jgi:hypothetical protein